MTPGGWLPYQMGVLGTSSEEVFDRLTRLASQVLNVPVTLMSLVDEDRQFFKSQIGLKEPWASRRETPLSHSFCQYVVASGRPLVIADAREDLLVRENLAIRDLDVIAYAGTPLVTTDGLCLGSFCAIDSIPRQWTDDELDILKEFSGLVMHEVELRLEETRRRAIFENISDVVLVVDTEGVIQFASRAVMGAIGRPPDELVGRHALELVNPDDRNQVERVFADMLTRRGIGPSTEARFLHEDGSWRWFALTCNNRIEEPTVGAVVVTARDITDWKAEQVEVQRLAAIVAYSDSAIISKALDGTITSWNPAAEALYGYAANEIVGHTVEVLLPPGHQNDVPELVERLRRGERIPPYDTQRRTRDGRIVEVTLIVSPIYDIDVVGISTIATDISERKQAERLMSEALEQQQAANAELERASRAQREFVSVVSHEFRTPLTSIQGFSEMMRDEELEPNEIKDFSDEIHRNAERLAQRPAGRIAHLHPHRDEAEQRAGILCGIGSEVTFHRWSPGSEPASRERSSARCGQASRAPVGEDRPADGDEGKEQRHVGNYRQRLDASGAGGDEQDAGDREQPGCLWGAAPGAPQEDAGGDERGRSEPSPRKKREQGDGVRTVYGFDELADLGTEVGGENRLDVERARVVCTTQARTSYRAAGTTGCIISASELKTAPTSRVMCSRRSHSASGDGASRIGRLSARTEKRLSWLMWNSSPNRSPAASRP